MLVGARNARPPSPASHQRTTVIAGLTRNPLILAKVRGSRVGRGMTGVWGFASSLKPRHF